MRQACAKDLSARELIDEILKTVKEFRGDEPQLDDMTCVVLRVEPKE